MPELKAYDTRDAGAAFDERLRSAVRGFANGAQTDADAVAVAERAMRRRRTGPLAWLGEAVPIPVPVLVVLGLLILALAMTLGIGAPWAQRGAVQPQSLASPALLDPAQALPAARLAAVASPWPATDARGDEVVVGTVTVALTTPPAAEGTGTPTRMRDGVATVTAATNDARANGSGTWQLNLDLYSKAGPAWGPLRLETADGAWSGPCRGSAWSGGDALAWSCWLTGTGGYDGFSYYLSATWSGQGVGDVRGVIVPAPPPVP
jgi:hypothetical protein